MRSAAPILLGLGLSTALVAAAPPTEEPSAAAREVIRAVDLGGLEARSAALILSGEEGGELDVSVLPIPFRGGPERVWVGLVIDVWNAAEPSDAAGDPRLTEVYAYALDERQEIGAFLTQAFALDAAERRGVKFFGHLDLAPGEYSLRVLVVQRGAERLGLRVLPLTVPPADAELSLPPLVADDPERWVLVREESADEPAFPLIVDGRPVVPATREPPTRPTSPTRPTRPTSATQLRRSRPVAAYAGALRRLAAGDRAAAISSLVEMERAALDRDARDVLVPSLLDFASRLAAIDGDSLVPLIQLHEALYREHHRQNRFQLATHARRMMLGLAEIYAEESGAASRRLAAGVLASLGGYLQEIGAMPAAEAAFERALEYDAAHEAALLALASIREAYGAHDRAAGLLKRLLEAHPGNAEARLRRAVCLERLGATRGAAALFRAGLSAETADWMRAVAYQELADLHVAEKRYQEAAALLGEALKRLPAFQRFHLQLAAVYDRMQRPAAARDAIARLDPRAGREADSPRLTYSRWPAWPIAESRRVLEEAAAARLEVLAAVLAQIDAAGG